MIKLDDNVYMITCEEDLPEIVADELFLDVETTSFNPKRKGDYPWGGDRICGIAFTWDDHENVYYIPVRHSGLTNNIDLEVFKAWLKQTLKNCKKWINHNIKFDAHFCYADGAEFSGEMIDTLVLSKMHDTDRGMYGLKKLFRDWLNIDTKESTEIKEFLRQIKSKNYGDVPADILGRYACKDVFGNRILYRFLVRERYDGAPWETEIKLTSVLFEMEQHGFIIDKIEVKSELTRTIRRIIDLSSKIAEWSGREFSNSSTWIYDYLINANGLPVLAYNEKTGKPTFDKKALALYESVTTGEIQKTVRAIREFRIEDQYRSLFLEPFLNLSQDGKIHPRYNQIVRTGRMSCSGPNIQQQNKRSKLLIHPRPGYGFISCDFSQIEFRLIAHYAKDDDIITAFQSDKADFHVVVASLIYGVPQDQVDDDQRSGGKTVNFGIAFTMGKRKLTRSLMASPIIIKEANAHLDSLGIQDTKQRKEEFERFCEERASLTLHTYHEKMPGIRRASNLAESNCKKRGYVFNAYGRRRHLSPKFARKGFNSVVQGGAMDLIKEALVTCRYDNFLIQADVKPVANVHDEIVFECPLDRLTDKTIHERILTILENPRIKFRVPIRSGLGISAKNWKEASGKASVTDSNGTVIAGRVR
jgi:DNA polymerase-1